MNDLELYNLSFKVASRYGTDTEELAHVGYLHLKEHLEGTQTPLESLSDGKVKGLLRSSMDKYKNYTSRTPSIPYTGTTKNARTKFRKGEVPETPLECEIALILSGEMCGLGDCEVETPPYEDTYIEKESEAYLFATALTALTRPEWEVIKCRVIYQMNLRDTCKELRMSTKTVIKYHERALGKLKEELEGKV
jgi:RNA polymerase sigma factor (sigma-70 family)